MKSHDNLRCLRRLIAGAGESEKSEAKLRDLLSRFVKSCPFDLMVTVATTVADYRAKEMKNEAESN